MNQQTVKAVCTNNNDPAKAGRILCSLPATDGAECPIWIEPATVPGWFSPPEPGDEVEVTMPAGEDLAEFADQMRYTGQVLTETTGPDKTFQPEHYPKRRGYRSPGGHLLIFDDKAGEEEIAITWKGKGSAVVLNKDGIFFGASSASEPFVLGNVLKSLLETLLDSEAAHTHIDPQGGVTDVPSNAVALGTLKGQLSTMLSQFIKGQLTKPT